MTPLQESDPREIDGYSLTGRLGAGGFGVVYAATTPDGQEVAIKVLRPELSDDQGLRTRLAREAAALRSVRGERNVQVLDVVTEGRWAYLVMELVEGDTLEAQVRNQGPLQGPMLWFVSEGLVEALADIHAAGIVHRDLKPSNVMFGPGGVKVLDFGVSAVAEQTTLTQTGAFVGTAAWISPEQIRGRDATDKSDVFNLGMVVGYAALGRHPFGSGRSDAVMYRISNEQPDLTGVASPLKEALERCLQRDPAVRPSIVQLREFFATNAASTLTATRPVSDTGTVIITPVQPGGHQSPEDTDETPDSGELPLTELGGDGSLSGSEDTVVVGSVESGADSGELPLTELDGDGSPSGSEDTVVVGSVGSGADSGELPLTELDGGGSPSGSEDTVVVGSAGGGYGIDAPIPVPSGSDRDGVRWLFVAALVVVVVVVASFNQDSADDSPAASTSTTAVPTTVASTATPAATTAAPVATTVVPTTTVAPVATTVVPTTTVAPVATTVVPTAATADNDSAGFTVTQSSGSTQVNESGTTDTFTVVLTAEPASNVVISVTSGDTGEATVSASSLTFTTSNWDSVQTITVTGVNDDIIDGSINTTITLAVVDGSSDNNFDPLANQTVTAATAPVATTVVPTTTTTTTTPLPHPLTGLPAVDVPSALPALAVKVDNTDARSLPHVGLEAADIVYETHIENGVTRFLAVFHSQVPEMIGQIRSARSSDIDLLSNLNTPYFAYWGSNGGVETEIRAAEDRGSFVSLNESAWPTNVFFHRDLTCGAGCGGFLDTPDLLSWAKGMQPVPVFDYGDRSAAAEPVAGVRWRTSDRQIDYVWNELSSRWIRFQDGVPLLNANGEQLGADNVILLYVFYTQSAADQRSPEALTTGSGGGKLLRDGTVRTITWERATAFDSWHLKESRTREIATLKPGTVWVGFVKAGEVEFLNKVEVATLITSQS